jgi:hypothetical protein
VHLALLVRVDLALGGPDGHAVGAVEVPVEPDDRRSPDALGGPQLIGVIFFLPTAAEDLNMETPRGISILGLVAAGLKSSMATTRR